MESTNEKILLIGRMSVSSVFTSQNVRCQKRFFQEMTLSWDRSEVNCAMILQALPNISSVLFPLAVHENI
jgi:hypothetical protein